MSAIMARTSLRVEVDLLEDLVAHTAGNHLAAARLHHLVELPDDSVGLRAADAEPVGHLRRPVHLPRGAKGSAPRIQQVDSGTAFQAERGARAYADGVRRDDGARLRCFCEEVTQARHRNQGVEGNA